MAVIITEYLSFLNMLIISVIFLIIAITIHEYSHALIAYKLGDPTAKIYGRLSLNPLKHIDPLGLLALFIFRIGWGKPVPIDTYNFKNPKRDEILVSIAGPASNFILASLISIIIKLISPPLDITYYLYQFISLNIFLAVFNLLPIWPLDGSKIFLNLVSPSSSYEWQASMEKYGYLLILVLAYTGILSKIITLLSTPILSLLL
jgi:Zn-dependent protease